MWCVYLDGQANRFHREDYFFAAICREIRSIFAKDPMSVKLDHFLIKFQQVRMGLKTDEEKQEHVERSKQAWLMAGAASMRRKPDGNARRT